MNYQWDEKKATSNLHKHGIDFADAVSVFADDLALTVEDEHPDEDRYVTIGIDALGEILVVVFTWRGDDIRIISVRKATRQEQNVYRG